MKGLCIPLLCLLPVLALAQSAEVAPDELDIQVMLDDPSATPFVGEMVMITIRGTYRRHITREKLVQPDLAGFNWSQLGADDWHEERLRGQKVKIFQRRMALYPTESGTLTIGPFRHKLTLTDQGDDWFDHQIQSDPIRIQVAPVPPEYERGWWFPVMRLRVSDEWSNAPDQLRPGEGVLRVIRIEALGATPEMIPPMPEMISPSAMIFPHPERRFVELTPAGPVTHAFWRWTVQPSNAVSTILEPLEVPYFDTSTRQAGLAVITPQRVAFSEDLARASVRSSIDTGSGSEVAASRLPGWPEALAAGLALALGLTFVLSERRFGGLAALKRFSLFDPLSRALARATRRGDAVAARRAATALLRRDGTTSARQKALDDLDRQIFAPKTVPVDLTGFRRRFRPSG